ncbi:MAG: hypothetical protein ACTHJV_00805 [Rhizobiaceae bacterium]
MKKLFLTAGAALAIVGGSFTISTPSVAAPHWHHHHRKVRVCRTIYRTHVFWRHGHRHVKRIRVGERCHWVRR